MSMSRRKFLATSGLAVAGAAAGGFAVRELTDSETRVAAIQFISGNRSASTWTVPAGQTLRFDPNHSTTLTLTGNMIVRGVLEMRPNPGVTHILRFAGVDNSRFVGGGNDPIPSDVGLWVVEGGRLNLLGAKTSETATVRDKTISVGRTVRIEATGGRAHTFIRTTAPAKQLVRGVEFRRMGASRPTGLTDPDFQSRIIQGRYALHFHRCGDTSRGSLVEDCIIRDADNRGYVPHASHGITYRRCDLIGGRLAAYWWDPPAESDTNETRDLLIEDPTILGVRTFLGDSPDQIFAAGIFLPLGQPVTIRRPVIREVRARGEGAGVYWPRSGAGSHILESPDVAYCDEGVFTWVENVETIRGGRLASNGRDVTHGAYRTTNRWSDVTFASPTAVLIRGTAKSPGASFDRCLFAGTFICGSHAVDEVGVPLEVNDSRLEAGIVVDQANEPGRGFYRFSRCTRAGRGLLRSDFTIRVIRPGTLIEIRNADGSTFDIRG
jgi:hypothetical protein